MSTDLIEGETVAPVSWIHALSVECEGLVVRIVLNDIDVFNEWEGAQHLAQTKLNPYIVEGSNRLEVFLTPMTDDEGRPIEGERYLRVELIRGEHGKVPDDTNRVARFEWNAAELPVEPGVLSGVWGRQFTVAPEHAFGRWAWQDAPAIAPTADDARALVMLAHEVHTALSNRDTAALSRLTSLKDDELSRAVDVPRDELRDETVAYYAGWFSSDRWSLEAFDPALLAATPYARGRLVRLTDPYGGPPIKGTDGERSFVFGFIACRIDGVWTIVR